MRAAAVIAWKDLRQRLRDRSALVIAFVAPFLIAVIISGAFGDGFGDSFRATYVVADRDGSELSEAFVEEVLGAPQIRENITVRLEDDEAAARRVVAEDDAAAAFVIPQGFQADATANRRVEIAVLRNPDSEIGSAVALALAQAYVDQINAARLSVSTTLRAGGTPVEPEVIAELGRAAAEVRLPIEIRDGTVTQRDVSAANYFGPAMAMFFLFFTTGFAARSLLAEREHGTLPRILASATRRTSVVAGKAASGFLFGLVSMAVIFLALGVLFDVDWGDPLALIVVTVLTVLALMSLTAVVQLLAKTQQQADAYSNAVAVALALVGGNFFPIFMLPDAIQRASLATPNGWALRAYADIGYDGATLTDLGPNLLVVTAFTVVMTSIALVLARRLTIK